MNRHDIILCLSILLIIGILYGITKIDNHKHKEAIVYYNNDIVLKIDMDKDDTYQVNGDNGIVIIEVLNNKIRVNEENSPKHICSKQGFINSSHESIICLPNKIVIEIKDSMDIDTIVR